MRLERATGADLGRLLAEQAGPQSELALTLEGVALGVEAADEDEVAVEAAQVLGREVRDVLVVVGVGDALALGGQQLDHVRAAVADRRGRLVQLGDYFVAHWGSFAGVEFRHFWSGRERGSPARRLGHTGPPRVTAEPEGPLNRNLPEAARNLTMRTPATRVCPMKTPCFIQVGRASVTCIMQVQRKGNDPMSTDLTMSFTVEQTPQQVFDAVNDVRSWWSGNIVGDTSTLGAEWTYSVPDIHFSKLRITELVPAECVSWLVLDSHLTFIEDKEEWTGTLIRFEITEESAEAGGNRRTRADVHSRGAQRRAGVLRRVQHRLGPVHPRQPEDPDPGRRGPTRLLQQPGVARGRPHRHRREPERLLTSAAHAAAVGQIDSTRAVSGPPASPVWTVPSGSMSTACTSCSATGQCSTPRGTTNSAFHVSSSRRSP